MRPLARSLAAAILAGSLATGATACSIDIPRATELDVRRAAAQRPGTTLAELEHGRSRYIAKCSSCHTPIAPRSIAAADWPRHVEEMSERAHLTAEDRTAIELYLTTIAAPQTPLPPPPAAAPAPAPAPAPAAPAAPPATDEPSAPADGAPSAPSAR